MITFEVLSDRPIEIPKEFKEELKKYRSQAKRLRVTISPVLKERTLNQNAYFHAKINQIAAETGSDREEIKKIIKTYAIGMGYPCKEEDGSLVLDKNGEPIPVSSASATIEQMTILIEALYVWCNENGIIIEEF